MQRVTKKDLNTLAQTITKALDDGHAYHAGQFFDHRWVFVKNMHTILAADTKSALHSHMMSFCAGVRAVQDRMPDEEQLARHVHKVCLAWAKDEATQSNTKMPLKDRVTEQVDTFADALYTYKRKGF